MHIAQINIAAFKTTKDDPIMQDFYDNIERVNAAAANSPGFIWRYDDVEHAHLHNPFNDNEMVVNMSVWQDINTLSDYVFKSLHLEIMKRKQEWFSSMKSMHLAIWYIEPGHMPTLEEGKKKLSHMDIFGSTPLAFNFRQPFGESEYLSYVSAKK